MNVCKEPSTEDTTKCHILPHTSYNAGPIAPPLCPGQFDSHHFPESDFTVHSCTAIADFTAAVRQRKRHHQLTTGMHNLTLTEKMASWSFIRPLPSLLGLLACLGLVTPFHAPPLTSIHRSAFSATRSSSVQGGSQRAVTFDRLLVNIGHDFNPETGRFRCRIPGAYYFTFTVGKYPKKLLSVMLVKNGQEVQAIAYNGGRKQGRKVQSQSVMVNLKPMDTMWLLLQESPRYAVYSNAGPYITFTGYLVYPDAVSSTELISNHLSPPGLQYPGCPPFGETRHRWTLRDEMEQPRSAFSVARTTSVLGERVGRQAKDALTFDLEYINIGGHFNKTSGHFTCRFPGAYFFAYTIGKHPDRAVSVKLMTGKGEVQAMAFDEDSSRHREMQSQSLLLSLHQGDTVWLYSQQDERYGVYSNQGRYTTFSGFLIYPDPDRTQF
ncbi:complement C1q tumor necrosis factor-related protein 4 [Denticeps clupeoides]|uniref:Complement C1q tumor necrosis factor-related protein 4 n=1 Tax=Denticeps clupeoides TaxID=299321 RepID=A0AAY4CRR9_9TELE|nr:complement C1q tumor necrosis factor-related protein 4-like [Denticeps clupeoides]